MSRRFAREIALKLLFQIDVGKNDPKEAMEHCFSSFNSSDNVKEYVEEVINGTLNKLQIIDQVLAKYLREWSLVRIANVDRNLLRLAVYELLYMQDIPPIVSINEGIELAKKYSTEESGKFVNGILGKVNTDKELLLKEFEK